MQMRILLCLLILLGLLTSPMVLAEISTDSTGDYASDLGQVYGGVLSVKFMKDICDEGFPELVSANDTAYQQWRIKYLSFLHEVERHWLAFGWREGKGDPAAHVEFLDKMADYFERYKEGLRKLMKKDGPEQFRKQCEIYPVYLTTGRTNLEQYYAEQVVTMRRGPKKE